MIVRSTVGTTRWPNAGPKSYDVGPALSKRVVLSAYLMSWNVVFLSTLCLMLMSIDGP